MRRTQLERLIGLTLEAAPGLSDIIITPGKLVQAECAGELKDVSPFGLGKITAYQCEALAFASDRAELGRGIDSLKSSRGEAVSDIGELRLDPGYGLEG